MTLKASEFIQNPDGSVYHLNLLPHQLANTVITVGDPDRVAQVTKYFDEVEVKVHKREFHTQTGYYKGKRISVISTGIGTDNIDIVFNELDALVNIDFESREIKKDLISLDIIRIGTSGAIQKDVALDSFLVSEMGVGFDSLLHFYKADEILDIDFAQALKNQLQLKDTNGLPYVVACNKDLASKFSDGYSKGVTVTNCGFYGPQGRELRLPLSMPDLNDLMASFEFNGKRITNLEMETAGIYGLSKLLGHRAVSLNAIIANRATGAFSVDPGKLVDDLIKLSLEKLVS